MAFRFFLVGAVAALGFDWPQGIDVDAWAQSGRAWWHARVAEFEARHGIQLAGFPEHDSETPTIEPEVSAPDADAAFATVIEDVVVAFAADGQSESIAEPNVSSPLVAGVDDATFGPDFADALNHWADGLSEPAEPATLVSESSIIEPENQNQAVLASISGFAGSAFASPVDEDELAATLTSPTGPTVSGAVEGEAIATSTQAEPRLVKAFQLTGQAFQAWLSLLQPAVPSSEATF